jgi:hypothetical protein
MLSAWLVSMAMSTSMVPPGTPVVNHAHPAHYGQPTVQLFERKAVDRSRGNAWKAYCDTLDQYWAEYRAAGSTPAAMADYKFKVNAAKTRYLVNDPYLLPIVDE